MLMKTHPRAIRWDCSDLGAPAFARVQNREIVYAIILLYTLEIGYLTTKLSKSR